MTTAYSTGGCLLLRLACRMRPPAAAASTSEAKSKSQVTGDTQGLLRGTCSSTCSGLGAYYHI
jgi:hypothetical protein